MIKKDLKEKIESWPHPNDHTACAILVQSFKAAFFFAAWPSFLRWEKVVKHISKRDPFYPGFCEKRIKRQSQVQKATTPS